MKKADCTTWEWHSLKQTAQRTDNTNKNSADNCNGQIIRSGNQGATLVYIYHQFKPPGLYVIEGKTYTEQEYLDICRGIEVSNRQYCFMNEAGIFKSPDTALAFRLASYLPNL